jgi:hypothetical protein
MAVIARFVAANILAMGVSALAAFVASAITTRLKII